MHSMGLCAAWVAAERLSVWARVCVLCLFGLPPQATAETRVVVLAVEAPCRAAVLPYRAEAH
jgi:hypothetical protein